jgi:hypothetical protein
MFRLYRRLRGEFGEPVYRHVVAPAEGQLAQCELLPGEAVEVLLEDAGPFDPLMARVVFEDGDRVVAYDALGYSLTVEGGGRKWGWGLEVRKLGDNRVLVSLRW